MGGDNEDTSGDIAIAMAPGEVAVTPIDDDEPPYGWVVTLALHLINSYTWGVIAVCGFL